MLEEKLRALRANGVAHAEFYEDGKPKIIDFFPSSEQVAQPGTTVATTANPYATEQRKPEIDLLADVIMQPDKIPELTEDDFPPEAIDYGASEAEAE